MRMAESSAWPTALPDSSQPARHGRPLATAATRIRHPFSNISSRACANRSFGFAVRKTDGQ